MTTTVELAKKICLIGDPGVGKTSLIRRFVTDLFDDNYLTTIGAKVAMKSMVLDFQERDTHVDLRLMIWDVSGQKEFVQFHEMYLKGMEGVLAVADLTRKNTSDSLKAAIHLVEKTGPDIPLVFLLNKCDLAEPTAGELKDVRTLASLRNIPVLITSARTGLNVEMAFRHLTRMILDDYFRKH